jgi:hypothetical protein
MSIRLLIRSLDGSRYRLRRSRSAVVALVDPLARVAWVASFV